MENGNLVSLNESNFNSRIFFFLLNLHLPEAAKDHVHKKRHLVLLDFFSFVVVYDERFIWPLVRCMNLFYTLSNS